jgi:HTH-type transcriptional repressor of NAD biosynthesis genes
VKNGLVLGKFMPLHNGHIALIDFALQHCDHLNILLCCEVNEPILPQIRHNWLQQLYGSNKSINIHLLIYDGNELPNTSVSSESVSKLWATKIKKILPGITHIFSSEKYGDYLANELNAKHLLFDIDRTNIPISATTIRNNIFSNWTFLPNIVQPYFVKTICLVGSESTGKSTLTKRLANYFSTSFVPEMARDVVEKTETVVPADLVKIAELHGTEILNKRLTANKLLFVDTDVTITKSYSQYLFKQVLQVPNWIEDANKMDLYFYLETDCDFVQDGTRLEKEEREVLNEFHKNEFKKQSKQLHFINGNWDERFKQCVKIIYKEFF